MFFARIQTLTSCSRDRNTNHSITALENQDLQHHSIQRRAPNNLWSTELKLPASVLKLVAYMNNIALIYWKYMYLLISLILYNLNHKWGTHVPKESLRPLCLSPYDPSSSLKPHCEASLCPPPSVMGEVYCFPRRQLIFSFDRIDVSFIFRKVFESSCLTVNVKYTSMDWS